MKGYLIRVGIDTTRGNIGYCAPVFADNSFEYIPIPQFSRPTSEESRYGMMDAMHAKYARFLSDYMHTDRHLFLDNERTPFIFSVDENEQPLLARDMVPHHGPEFVTNTFGDARATSGGRIPSDLYPGDCVFFYSGLARYDPSFYQSKRRWSEFGRAQIHNKCTFLIGYMRIKRVFDIKTEEDLVCNRSEIRNNAHFKEEMIDCAIIKGEDDSRLLVKALQLNYWNPKTGKYSPTDIGKKIGLRPTTGMRVMKWLNAPLCKELLGTMRAP